MQPISLLPMLGSIEHGGRILHAGFMTGCPVGIVPNQAAGDMTLSRAEFAEALGLTRAKIAELGQADIQRSEFTGNIADVLGHLGGNLDSLEKMLARTMTSSDVPHRENLEAPAVNLVPLDCPLRNRLPRRPGAGTAVQWRQLSSLGGGFGTDTTVTSGASSATQTVGSTVNMAAGDVLHFGTTNADRTISSVTNATTVVLTATISTTTAETVTRTSIVQPGAGAGQSIFYAETGSPNVFDETYISKTAGYKLLGALGKITNFAVASGRSYQDQLAAKRTNTLRNVMLNEENALTRADSAADSLAFDGLYKLVSTANGVPSAQIQTGAGALTLAIIDGMLHQLTINGARGIWLHMSGQEILSLTHLSDATGSIIRIQAQSAGNVVLGAKVTGYVSPITGEMVDLMYSRFASTGTIVFGADLGPEDPAGDGSSDTMVVSVLPQVPLPDTAPESPQEIQGYTVTELARDVLAADTLPLMVSVYETLQMRNARTFCKVSGLSAV